MKINNLINQLKATGKWESTLLLGIMSLLCIAISIFRIYYSQNMHLFFLNWNLFLAFIPWLISTILVLIKKPLAKTRLFLTAIVWLLFFPNCAYVLTDLFHIYKGLTIPFWFDFSMILMFAITALFYGLVSLKDMELLFKPYFNKRSLVFIVLFIGFLAAFGVYLGRFQRWNSWDVLSNPLGLIKDIADRIVHPTAHLRTWTFTFLFGLVLNFIYFSIKGLTATQKQE